MTAPKNASNELSLITSGQSNFSFRRNSTLLRTNCDLPLIYPSKMSLHRISISLVLGADTHLLFSNGASNNSFFTAAISSSMDIGGKIITDDSGVLGSSGSSVSSVFDSVNTITAASSIALNCGWRVPSLCRVGFVSVSYLYLLQKV